MSDVLLIEDNQVLRQQLYEGLVDARYRVYDAENGLLGLRLFEQHRPAVVVTDLIMDGGEGIESILTLRQLDREVGIIAISGNSDYLNSSAKLGADRILLKPFRMDDLIAAIESLDNGPR